VCFDVFVCFSFVQFNISVSIIRLFRSCVFYVIALCVLWALLSEIKSR